MKRVMTLRHIILCLLAPALLGAALPLEKIRLPPGFAIAIYAHGLPAARSMTFGDSGTLFVGSSGEKVFAVPAHEDGKAATPLTLADGKMQGKGARGSIVYTLYQSGNRRVLKGDATLSDGRQVNATLSPK